MEATDGLAADIVDATGIADRTGVHPEYPETWKGRDRFPDPVAQLSIGKVWFWPDVEAWIGS